jgi:hypothetical protein
MALGLDTRDNVSATATGTNAGATATVTAAANRQFCVTHISGRSDAATQLQILGGAAGATVIWQIAVQANVPFTAVFPDGALLGVTGQSVAGKVVASTAGCEVNVAGYQIASV